MCFGLGITDVNGYTSSVIVELGSDLTDICFELAGPSQSCSVWSWSGDRESIPNVDKVCYFCNWLPSWP